ncbi:hypothetical protein L596_017770 [Steinernema carpocapsae]|uniref:Uncharacterized protein n=1 Tax=Steinernema carpocapsae TaxID=34508 RepID=A0A4U5N2W0_STECR|nr:hypothetical protein L596_017770 [Steinernema carpocapsae]
MNERTSPLLFGVLLISFAASEAESPFPLCAAADFPRGAQIVAAKHDHAAFVTLTSDVGEDRKPEFPIDLEVAFEAAQNASDTDESRLQVHRDSNSSYLAIPEFEVLHSACPEDEKNSCFYLKTTNTRTCHFATALANSSFEVTVVPEDIIKSSTSSSREEEPRLGVSKRKKARPSAKLYFSVAVLLVVAVLAFFVFLGSVFLCCKHESIMIYSMDFHDGIPDWMKAFRRESRGSSFSDQSLDLEKVKMKASGLQAVLAGFGAFPDVILVILVVVILNETVGEKWKCTFCPLQPRAGRSPNRRSAPLRLLNDSDASSSPHKHPGRLQRRFIRPLIRY